MATEKVEEANGRGDEDADDDADVDDDAVVVHDLKMVDTNTII